MNVDMLDLSLISSNYINLLQELGTQYIKYRTRIADLSTTKY